MLVNPHPLYKGGQAGLAGDPAGGLAAGISRYLVHSPSTRGGAPSTMGTASRIQPQGKPHRRQALTFHKWLWGAPGIGTGSV